MADDSGSEHTRLAALVGTWETEGWTRAAPGVPAARIDALDTYEWLPGGSRCCTASTHRSVARRSKGPRSSGYDPARRVYVTQ